MKNLDRGRILENIVAIELIRRGYEVYVGVMHHSEIDFVAMKQHEKVYFQVADDISNSETFKRETDSLLKIRDAYPKVLIASTRQAKFTYEGILVCNISDWLRDDIG